MDDSGQLSMRDHDRMYELVKEEKYKKEAKKWKKHYRDLARKSIYSRSNLANGEWVEMACPKCGTNKLVVRQNKFNNGQFLGCSNWPGCSYTRSIPEHLVKQEKMTL